ncbi:MAG: hypothetical protein ACTSRB_13870 [Candidatus Helarchaeota archaeon]
MGIEELSDKPNLIQLIVDGLGLNEAQAKAFVGLYARGYVTDSKISAMSGMSLDEARQTLQMFIEKGLANKIPEPVRGIPRYMPTVPWSAFTSYLDTFQVNIANLREEFDKNIKDHIDALKKEVLMLKTGVAEAVNNQIAKFNEETLKAKEKTSQVITKHITTLNESIENRKQETSAVYKQKIEAHENTLHSYEKELANALDLKYTVITEGTQKIEDDATSGHQNSIKTLEKNIGSVLDDFTGKILDQTKQETDKSLQKLNEHLDKSHMEYVSKTVEILNNHQKETFSDYDELVQELDKHQNNTFGEYDSWYEDLSKKILAQIETEIAGVKEKNSELKEEIKKSQEINFEWFKTRAAIMRERAAEVFNKEIEHQENTFSHFGDSIKGITGDLINRFKSMLEDIRQTFESKIDAQLGTLKSVTDLEKILGQDLDKKISAIKADSLTVETKINKSAESTITEISQSIDNVKEKVKEKINQINKAQKEDLKGIIKDSQKNVSKTLKNAVSQLDEWAAEFKKAGETFIKDVSDRAKALSPEDQEIKEKVTELKTFKDELKLKSIIDDQKQKFEEYEQELDKILNELFDKVGKESDDALSDLTNLLEDASNTLKEALSNISKDLRESIKGMLEDNITVFQKNAEVFSVEIAAAFNAQIEKIESDFYQVKGTLSGNTDALVKQFKDILDEVQARFLEKIKEQITRLETETGNLEKTLSETLDERITTYRKEIDQMRENFYTGADLRVSNLEKQSHAIRESAVVTLLSDLIRKHKDSIREIQAARNSSIGKHKTNLESITREKQKEISNVTEGLKEDIKKVMQEEMARTTKVQTEGHNALDKMKNEVNEFVNKDIERVNTMAADIQTKISTEVEKGFNTIKTEINGIDEKHLKSLAELTTSVGEKHNEIISKHGNEFQSDASTMEVELLDLATAHQNEYELNANSLNDQLAGKLEETDVILTDRLMNVNDDAAKQFKECEEQTQERAKILRAVWNETERILATSGELTWILVTQEAIEEYMADMIHRTKSTISLVTPDFETLPFDTIQTAKRAMRIKTASRILADDRDKVAVLLEQGNVEIRQRKDRDLWAAARDGEEVLIAPMADKETQKVAIISQEPAIVKYFHEIIGPLVMARAQRISHV